MRMKVLGFIPITKNQFIIFETIFFSFFFLLTVFLFSYKFPIYIEDPLVLFHSKYLKYVTLVLSFLIVIETQYYLNRFISKQLELNEKQKNKIEFQNKEIKEQNEEIQNQNDEIKYQNNEITKSIKYAGRIQEAILPSQEELRKKLDYFILYKPKDIVSGDYYWFSEKHNKLIIVTADSTGHGVPGAFMSILGISSLNEIINETKECLNSDEILNRLRKRIINSLKHENEDLVSEAGMDLAIIIFDKERKEIQFSGAKNPLFLIRNVYSEKLKAMRTSDTTVKDQYELYHIKPDKMPIGKYPVMKPFSKETIKLLENDTLYLFSDGFIDQYGGKAGKKLMSKRFKELLLKIQDKNMDEQKYTLNKALNKWKNNNDQTDDIIVFGIRV